MITSTGHHMMEFVYIENQHFSVFFFTKDVKMCRKNSCVQSPQKIIAIIPSFVLFFLQYKQA